MQPVITQADEKKLLIESMKKLVSHLSRNPQRQFEIFNALSLHDFNKILNNLRDENQYLRRISALLLCELFFMCPDTKKKAIDLLAVQPSGGRICLGGIPESIARYPSTLKKCIDLMKSPAEEGEEDKMCWLINLERKTLKLQTLQYKNYSSFTFIDPHKNIFGFTLPTKPIKINSSVVTVPRTPVSIESMKHSTKINEDFYNNYTDAKNRSSESKRDSFQGTHIDLGSVGHSATTSKTDRLPGRPNTAFQFGIPSTTKRESIEVRNGANLNSSMGGRYISGIDKIINSGRHNDSKDQTFSTYRKAWQADKTGSRETSRERERLSSTMTSKDPSQFYQRVRDILHK